jgi:hypothetical protein
VAKYFDTSINVSVLSSAPAWVDVDVSAYCPVGTTGVICELRHHIATFLPFGWRKKGSTDTHLQYLSGGMHTTFFVGVDSNRVFETSGFLAPGGLLQCYLIGYFTNDANFLTNSVDLSPGVAWGDIDLSGTLPVNAIAAIFQVGSLITNVYVNNWGIRNNGSTDNFIGIANTGGFICGVDVNRICEMQKSSANIFIKLVGYLTKGLFKVNGLDKSTAIINSWQPVDLSLDTKPSNVAAAVVQYYHGPIAFARIAYWNGTGVGGDQYEYYYDGTGGGGNITHCYPVGLNSSDIFYQYIEDVVCDTYVIGYLVAEGPTMDLIMRNGKWFGGGVFQGSWLGWRE